MAIGFVLILLMVMSVLGYGLLSSSRIESQDSDSQVEYNSYVFTSVGGLWRFQIESQEHATSYNPKETEDIEVAEASLEDYYNKPLYFVSGNPDALNEFMYNIRRYASRAQEVCLQGELCAGDFVEKNCSSNIIMFKTNEDFEKVQILREDNCLFIEGKSEEMARASDRIVFKLLGVQE